MAFNLTDYHVGDEFEGSARELGIIISAVLAAGGSFDYVGRSITITSLPDDPAPVVPEAPAPVIPAPETPEPKPEPDIIPEPVVEPPTKPVIAPPAKPPAKAPVKSFSRSPKAPSKPGSSEVK